MANKALRGADELKKVKFTDFIKEWDNLVIHSGSEIDPRIQREDFMCTSMGQTSDVIQELDEVCSIEHLLEDPDQLDAGHVNIEEVPEPVTLHTLVNQKEEIEFRNSESRHLQRYRKNLKYLFLFQHSAQTLHAHSSKGHDDYQEVARPEVLINVRVYRTYCPANQENLQVSQELQVLGCQPLSALRDKINCPNDYIGAFERTTGEGPKLPNTLRCKDVYTSSFFFIGNTFYNDLRHPESKDCSESIIKWREKYLAPEVAYARRDMARVLFGELAVELGYPYLYQHQGECEHLITFTDVALVGPTHCLDVRQYPMVVGRYKRHAMTCRSCITLQARWLVRSSILTPEDPCYLCDDCYRALHFDKHGNKLVHFKAYILCPPDT